MMLENSHNELSQRFTQLSNQRHQQINAQAQSIWQNELLPWPHFPSLQIT